MQIKNLPPEIAKVARQRITEYYELNREAIPNYMIRLHLGTSFNWAGTPEGYGYWSNVNSGNFNTAVSYTAEQYSIF